MVGNGVVVLEEAMIVLATVCYTIQLTLGFSEARPFPLDVRVDFWATSEGDKSQEQEETRSKHLNLRVTVRVCINEYNTAAGQMKQQGGQTWRRKALRVAEKVCQIN
jgi:hypothetical protein